MEVVFLKTNRVNKQIILQTKRYTKILIIKGETNTPLWNLVYQQVTHLNKAIL